MKLCSCLKRLTNNANKKATLRDETQGPREKPRDGRIIIPCAKTTFLSSHAYFRSHLKASRVSGGKENAGLLSHTAAHQNSSEIVIGWRSYTGELKCVTPLKK